MWEMKTKGSVGMTERKEADSWKSVFPSVILVPCGSGWFSRSSPEQVNEHRLQHKDIKRFKNLTSWALFVSDFRVEALCIWADKEK